MWVFGVCVYIYIGFLRDIGECVRVYAYIHICMYVYIYIYVYLDIGR